jgi:nucleoside-diphosphate-sugar epimerase
MTKADSSDPAERKVAESLARSEASVANACERLGIAYTIFRPTLIYGAGRDRNISDIARIVERFGVFPILGNGIGLRQPVHSADLVQACILAGDHSESVNRIYNLSGGETLAYREMVQRIFRAMDKRAKIVSIPEPLFRLAIRFAKLSPRFKHLKPEMAKRMDRNLCFDHLSAVKDFGYAPRPFLLDRDELGLK